MAHKKAAGSTRLGRDSESKRLGVKRYGDSLVNAGEVLVRQRGTKVHAGANVKRGADDTLYAVVAGRVSFHRKLNRRFTGALVSTQFVAVVPEGSTEISPKREARQGITPQDRSAPLKATRGSRPLVKKTGK